MKTTRNGFDSTNHLIAHISGDDTYKVLTKEEEQALYTRYINQPDELSTQLVLHSLYLPIKFARKYKYVMDMDDIYQVACIGLVLASRKFEPNRGSGRFITYASYKIKTSIRDYLRGEERSFDDTFIGIHDTMTLNTMSDEYTNDPIQHMIVKPHIDNGFEIEWVYTEMVRTGNYSKIQELIFFLMYIEGNTITEVGHIIHKSRQYVFSEHKRMMIKINKDEQIITEISKGE